MNFINEQDWQRIYTWARDCGLNLPHFIRRAMMFQFPGGASEVMEQFYAISEEQFYHACYKFQEFHLAQAK